MIRTVLISAKAEKSLRRIPNHILDLMDKWIENVEYYGLEEVRKRPGYHDEPLHGWRRGQRSIRLNRSYRAVYIICEKNRIKFVSIEEVNKHDY